MRLRHAVLASLALTVLAACSEADPGGGSKGPVPQDGTETNVAPAPCTTDEDCGEGIACLVPDGSATTGFCEIAEP